MVVVADDDAVDTVDEAANGAELTVDNDRDDDEILPFFPSVLVLLVPGMVGARHFIIASSFIYPRSRTEYSFTLSRYVWWLVVGFCGPTFSPLFLKSVWMD